MLVIVCPSSLIDFFVVVHVSCFGVLVDAQDIRQHFVAYEAANHELGNKILAHVVPDA